MIGSAPTRAPWFRLICQVLVTVLLVQMLPPLRLRLPFDLLAALGPSPAYAQAPTALPPDIAVSRSVTPATTGAVQNNRVTVSYVVFNRQGSALNGVLLTTTLRPGVSLASASPFPDRNAGELAWSLGTLAPFASTTVQLTVTVPNPIPLQIDEGARAFGTLNARSVSATAPTATLRAGVVDDALLRSTLDASTTDSFVLAKAAELGHDPARIFAFVRDGIGYEAYKGSLRGARGTVWSQAGNALDKANLLIALLRASGVPSRYVKGTLDDATARRLLASMFPPSIRAVGLVPAGAAVADPLNDAKLLAEAREHYWVEFDDGTGFRAADPAFPDVQIGQTLVAGETTFVEVPDSLRHHVTVRLTRELTTPASGLFAGGSGQGLATVLEQTIATVELVGRPVSIGHFVTSQTLSAIFSTVTNTYAPYLRFPEENGRDPRQDRVIRGQDYQELLTDFPLGNQILTGVFLEVDVAAPDGATQSYRRTLVDRIGVEARKSGGTTTIVAPVGATPIISPLDVFTIAITPGRHDVGDLGAANARLETLGAETTALAASVQAGLPPDGPALVALGERAVDTLQVMLVAAGRARLAQFLSLSDVFTEQFSRDLQVKVYADSPRVTIFGSRVALSPGQAPSFELTFDLRRNNLRAVVAPGQAPTAGVTFELVRGFADSAFEAIVMGQAPPDPGVPVNETVSADAIFTRALAQGVQLIPLAPGDEAIVDTLPIPAVAKILIHEALARGLAVIVPARAIEIGGRPRVAWYEVDQDSGTAIGVLDDGSHGAGLVLSAAADVASFVIREANQFAMGALTAMGAVSFLGVVKVLLLVAAGAKVREVTNNDGAVQKALALAVLVNALTKINALFAASYSVSFRLGAGLALAWGTKALALDPPLPDAKLSPDQPLPTPRADDADVTVAASRAGGAVNATLTTANLGVGGAIGATWQTTGIASSLLARSLNADGATVHDAGGTLVGSGQVALNDARGVTATVSGTVSYSVNGQGRLAFYPPATANLGVSGEWSSYTAALSGDVVIELTTDGLRLNGVPLPSGTYRIGMAAASVTGGGASTSPSFVGTAALTVSDAAVEIGPGNGAVTVEGVAIDPSEGLALVGFAGTVSVTAGASTDAVAITGNAPAVLRVAADPGTLTTDQNQSVSFQTIIDTSVGDTYTVTAEAPVGWIVDVSNQGLITATPATGTGSVDIRLTAKSRTNPALVAQAAAHIALNGTAPGVTIAIEPDPLFTVPVAGAQVPTAFQARIRNVGPASDTFALTFPTVPAGFEVLASETSVVIPAGKVAVIGLYLRPLGALPPAGTPATFGVTVTSTSNPAIVASDTESFVLPEVHGVVVSADPRSLSIAPGTTVDSTITLTAVGNVPETVGVTASVASGLTLQGLATPVVLSPGQSSVQVVSLTPQAGVPLNSFLTAGITASFGSVAAPLTETALIDVQVVVPSAQSAIDASVAARNAGQGALADALRDLGLAITDLFGAPADAVLRVRVLADIDRLIEGLIDPAFATLVTQLQNIRASIAAGTPQSLPGDLATLDGVLNEVANTTVSTGRHRFAARLEPNRQVASPQVPVSFQLSVQNLGTETTTYQLTVEGLPGNVTSQLSASSVTLAPGEASANLGVTLTHTSATALVAVGFNVRITPAPAPELSQTVSGSLTARAEIVSVVNVTATPPFAPAGTARALSARLLNAVNQVRQVSIDFVVKDATGAVVHQASSPPFELSVLASLATVDLGTLNTTGFANGTFTVDVTVKNSTGAAIPGATGTGTFMVGTPVTASIAVTPEIVPAGTRTVSTTLRIDSQVPLSNQFAQIAQVPGAAHTVALKGTVGYFCGPNGIQIVDVSDPENPVVQGTFGAGEIVNSGLTACKVSGDLLIVRTQVNGNITLQLRVYSIANPTAPQLLSATPATADYFFAIDLVLAGSTVLTPTQGFCFFFANHDVFEHHGDLAAFDISNPAAPAFAGVIFNGPIRNLSGCLARGGPNNNWQSVLADPTTLLMGSTTVQGTDAHAGVGRIRVVDIANPAQMSIVDAGELQIPGTVHLMSLAKDGTLGVALGSTGGWGDFQPDLGMTGTIVVATLDLTNPRQPALIATRELTRLARGLNRMEAIGNGLFIASSLGGVNDPPQVLLIDARDPQNPIVSQVDLPIETVIAAVDGDIIYGTSAAGFSIFRLGAVGIIPVTAQVQIPKGTGVTIVPNSFSEDPDEIVAGAQFDTLVWRRGLNAGALSLTFTWQEQVANVQPGEAREVTLNTTVDFESAGTEGRIPLGPRAVLAEQVIALAPATRTVRPGEVASYTVIVKNPSTSTVEYDLTVEGVAPELVTILSHVTVPAGSTQQLSLTLRTEPLAALGEYGFAVNARALGIEASVLGTLILSGEPVVPDGEVRGVVVSLTPGQATAGQGTAATFTLRVTNVGSVEDTYAINVAVPGGFTTTATPSSVTVPVGIGNFSEVQLTAVPPPGTPVGSVDISAQATSIADPAVFAEASGIVSVVAVGVTVALDPPSGPPGSAFQMTVTNTGAVAETFDLSVGGPAAVASTLGASSVVLAPGASQIVSVNVGSIGFAIPGSLDLTGAATARTNTAVKASATARVTIGETAGVAASFDPAVVVLPAPGGAAFLLQVTSTGNKEESYQASIVGTSGPIAASLADLDGFTTQRVPLFRIPGLAGAAFVLNATLLAPGQGTVTVRVQSLTDQSIVAEATASLQSQSSNTPPIANAGPDQDVPFGTVVTLDGSGSQDPDGAPQPLTFAWTFVSVPAGSALNDAEIDAPATAHPSFEPDVRGEYVLRLTVSDGSAPASDEVLIRVVNTAPVAIAGRERHVATATPATLDGSESFDRDGDLITYAWSFQSVPSGSGLTTAAITGATSPDPSFVPDVPGAYVLQLVVRDQEAESEPSLVTVRAFAANIPPVAHAGPDRHVAVNVSATLDGRASEDPDAGPGALTFAWTVVQVPAGSLIATGSLTGADQSQASFIPDVAGDYRLALRVGDGEAFSDDEVIVTAQTGNVTPNASAGPNVVAVAGVAVTLDGSASVDPDGGPAPLTYRWRFVSLPAGSSLSNAQIADAEQVQARFTPDIVGSYVLELTVFDGAAADFDNVLVVAGAAGVATCFGRPATIFVRDSLIVGGPDHGKRFRGTLKGTVGDDVIVGTAGNDRIAGNGGNDVICGGDGDDVIDGGTGHDMIDGGDGNDLIRSHGGNDVVLGGDGNDTIEMGFGDDEADGGRGDDRIKNQQGGRDVLRGGDGNDTLEGGAGTDVMEGGVGRDTLKGQAGDDVLDGGPDDDRLDGGPGRDDCRDEGTNVKNCER